MTKQPFCFSLLLLICVSIPLMATAQVVNIPDGKLRAAVEKALGKASGDPISVAEMATLTKLTAQNKKISNLTGLESATNLKQLYLKNNRISNISPVAGLTKLRELQLSNNRITDISAIEGLTRLKKLYLNNNRITDISSIVANTGFERRDLVSLRGNPLSAESIITDIPTLQGRGVQVRFDAPETVTIPDANLRAKIEHALGKTAGATITPAEMATLTELTAKRANINDLTGLEYATNLTDLDLRNNSISDISAVVGLTNLRYLYLRSNSISDISAVVGLTNLTDLDLRSNSISDISAVEDLTNLTHLYLRSNSISDISAVEDLTNLTHLYLRSNSVSDISAVEDLTNLRYLYLRSNSISDISAVAGLTKLTTLDLEGNIISDISAVVSNTGLGSGDEVNVRGNPLSDVSMNTHIPALESREVKVVWSAETGAAPALARIAPVLGVSGAIDDQTARLNTFRVIATNLSNGKAATGLTTNANGVGYKLTIGNVETGQAATIGDTLEITAQSPDPFIGVQPVRHTVTAEDVRRSLIQLPELVVYEIPRETELLANYPNPFNPETWIPYRLAEDAFVTLTIYDQGGRIVHTLDVGHRIAAVYESRSKAVYWDGRNGLGEHVASGVYFYTLTAGDFSATRRMVIVK